MIRTPFLNLHLYKVVLLAVSLLTACQPELSPRPVNTPSDVSESTVLAVPTSVVTEQAPAKLAAVTVTPSSTDQSCNFIEEVQFPHGGTSFLTSGMITSAVKHCFLLGAGANQLLTVSASSAEDNMLIDVFTGDDMAAVIPRSPPSSQWVGLLPATQGYLIVLTTTGTTADYFLSIELPANLILEPPQNSLEINGGITINQNFHPDILTRVRYRLYVPAGRTLSVNLTPPELSDLSLGIYGEFDGQPYKRFEILGNDFSLEMPVSQYYYLDIYGVSGVDSPFKLQLNITD